MKKRGYFIFLLLILSLALIQASNTTITRQTSITGEASSQETTVSVMILPAVPVLRIISPTNASTYNPSDYILLDYTSILMETVWYNLDGGDNTIINDSLYFQTTSGDHILYLYGNHSNGTIYSNTSSFTVTTPYVPPSGGGGGASIEKKLGIDLEETQIIINLKQGETKTIKLLIENKYKKQVDVDLTKIGKEFEEYLTNINPENFSLAPKESKEVTLTFYANKNSIPDMYLGQLIINLGIAQEKITFGIEIESPKPLFDVKLDFIDEKTFYSPEEELQGKIDIYNLGKSGKTNIEIEYIIKDKNGKEILRQVEQTEVGTQLSFLKNFKIPKDLENGEYLLYIKVKYDGKTASSSKWFTVKKVPFLVKKLRDFFSRLGNLLKRIKDFCCKNSKNFFSIFFLIILILMAFFSYKLIRKKFKIKQKNKKEIKKY